MSAKVQGQEISWGEVSRTVALVACGWLLSNYFSAARDFVRVLRRDSPPVQNGIATATKKAEDSDSDATDEELSKVKAGSGETCKLVLVVRTDLGMSSGKIAAQCSHATLACYKQLYRSNPALVKHWETTGQAKIALKVDSEDALLLLQAQAQSLGLCARTIQDAGRTQVDPGTTTVLGIGPATTTLIDQVTGKLRLL